MRTKFMCFIGALLIVLPTFGFSPIMGNLKVNQASCGGEDFLWKKHDSVVLSGDFMVLSGSYEKDIPIDGETCRFEDRYIRTEKELEMLKSGVAVENSQLVAQMRVITCYDYSKGQEPVVTKKEIESPLLKTKIEMDGRDFVITLEERNLCDSTVDLKLSHNIP